MQGQRDAELIVVGGKKMVGKSYLTTIHINNYVRGNPQTGAKPRKVLIFDVNDEFTQYKGISLEHIALFSAHPTVEVRRVRPFHGDGSVMTNNELAEALMHIIQYFRGGLLLIEDYSKYLSDSLPQDVIGAICTNRHRACDIIIHVQSIGRIVPKVWQNVTWVRFHKHNESVDKSESKLSDFYEVFKLVEYMVNKQYYEGNERFYLYINIDKVNIVGNYTKQMLLDAIKEYMSDNYSKIVKPMLNKFDIESGKRIHTVQSALKAKRDQLYNTYYGN